MILLFQCVMAHFRAILVGIWGLGNVDESGGIFLQERANSGIIKCSVVDGMAFPSRPCQFFLYLAPIGEHFCQMRCADSSYQDDSEIKWRYSHEIGKNNMFGLLYVDGGDGGCRASGADGYGVYVSGEAGRKWFAGGW